MLFIFLFLIVSSFRVSSSLRLFNEKNSFLESIPVRENYANEDNRIRALKGFPSNINFIALDLKNSNPE